MDITNIVGILGGICIAYIIIELLGSIFVIAYRRAPVGTLRRKIAAHIYIRGGVLL